MRDKGYKDAAFHPSSQLRTSLALFLSPGNEVGRLFLKKLPAQKVIWDWGWGGGGVAYLQGCLKCSWTLPKFSSAIFFPPNWVDG